LGRRAPATLIGSLTIRAKFALLAFFACGSTAAEVYLTEGTNISVDVTNDGRAAIDLLGGIWVLPSDGGEALAIQSGLRPARRPRWSPAANALVYQASTAEHNEIWLHLEDDGLDRRLGDGPYFDQHPDWHPDGERIVFSSARNDSDFDLWEFDLPTGLAWRLSYLPGDETEPAWSADGRSLIYIHELNGQWSLMLRRHGQADEVLVRSGTRLAAPSWRPDGSLVTFMKNSDEGWSIRMAILSNPILDRTIVEGEDFFVAPVVWQDRQHMLYTANGRIRKRNFNSRSSANVPFRAAVGKTNGYSDDTPAMRDLPPIDEPQGTTVIRAGQLFDGIDARYRNNADIIIEGGRIVAVENRADRPGSIVIDLGDITVLPGFIDAYAALPDGVDGSLGPLLLSLGVTTLVAEIESAAALNAIWSGKEVPGPRVLIAQSIQDAGPDSGLPWLVSITGDMNAGVAQRELVQQWQAQGVAVLADSWQVGLGSGASLLVGTASMPTSPAGRSYQDVQMASGVGAITFVSGLADSATPNIETLRNSRQAGLLPASVNLTRRFAQTPDFSAAATSVVVGSQPNGLPPGIALHAEFLALQDAGLNAEQTLKAAGINAANALGLGLRLGRISQGAAADLVLVDGDPLNDIGDALKIVGVVRNGRFFSVSGLIDRSKAAQATKSVE
jgi:Amidohydrolase family/WD40-like Beta Propeller Repeat